MLYGRANGKLRILYVFDVAGISCIYSKFMKMRGHACKVVSRASQDGFGFLKHYHETTIGLDGGKAIKKIGETSNSQSRLLKRGAGYFIKYIAKSDSAGYKKRIIKMAKDYDIIHVNSIFDFVPEIKAAHPNKKIVLSYTGSELVINKDNPERQAIDEMVDKVIVNTSDLLIYQPKAAYIPQPIDTEHFKRDGTIIKKGIALTFGMRYNDVDKLKEILNGFSYEIIDREKNFIPYSKMPYLLNQYAMYIDMKFDVDRGLARVASCTGLQALACGVPVMRYDQKIITEFPKEHDAVNVAERLEKVYSEL